MKIHDANMTPRGTAWLEAPAHWQDLETERAILRGRLAKLSPVSAPHADVSARLRQIEVDLNRPKPSRRSGA
jgi:hypothetical protein